MTRVSDREVPRADPGRLWDHLGDRPEVRLGGLKVALSVLTTNVLDGRDDRRRDWSG